MRKSFPLLWLVAGFAAASTTLACARTVTSPPRTESRALGDNTFTSISARGWVDVHVAVAGAGEEQSVHVKCDEERLPKIHTKVENGALVIETDSDNQYGVFHFSSSSYREEAMRTCIVDVQMPKLTAVVDQGSGDVAIHGNADGLQRISTYGSGSVHVDSLKTSNTLEVSSMGSGAVVIDALDASDVRADMKGSGDVRTSGSAHTLHVSNAGSGDLDARALRADEGHIRLMGSGDVSLFASQRVDIEAIGSGDILVMGHPSQKASKVQGSGSIRWE